MILIKPLTVGPIVGHASSKEVRIWGRAEYEFLSSGPRRAFGVAHIKEKGEQYQLPKVFKMNPNFDMSGVVIFSSLQENTKYEYQIGYFYSDKELEDFSDLEEWDWDSSNPGQFVTASTNPMLERTFIFGSCRYLLRLFNRNLFDDRGDKTFRSILEQIQNGESIDKFLMLGDQIYADDLNILTPDNHVEDYLLRYRDVFSQPYIKKLLSQVSTYMTLDDHEIEDNWPQHASSKDWMWKYPAAMHAYQVYQVSHSPVLKNKNGKLLGTPEEYYYEFEDGCCRFFVTDTRTERSLLEGKENQIISSKQMKALLKWLDTPTDQVKLLVSSVLFFPDMVKVNNDQWRGFIAQRDEIISHIQKHNIQKVVFLSGDVHCSMAAELDVSKQQDGSLKIYSIISSSFFWPYPHSKAGDFQLSGDLVSKKNMKFNINPLSNVYSGDNFSRVIVSNKQLKVIVYQRKGELAHDFTIDF